MNIDLEAAQERIASPGSHNDVAAVQSTDDTHGASRSHANTYERWTKTPKSRGRQPRNPQSQSVKFQCRDIDDLENYLREYLRTPTVSAEHATLEFTFPVSAAFMVYAADFKNVNKIAASAEKQSHLYGKMDRTAISIADALTTASDSKDQMRRQKAIAKVSVEACEKADGFRYSFHNNWKSGEDNAYRFSYFCNDSTLNKGRAANECAGMLGKKMRKPVYNCQGLIAIKFSSTKQSLEVHYKHVPLHKTYAERAPPPRKDSKRRKVMEVLEPASLTSNKKKRNTGPLVPPLPRRSRQDRASNNIVATASPHVESQAAEPAREETLQPLIEFLGFANDIEPSNHSLPNASADQHVAAVEPAIETQSVELSSVPDKQFHNKPRRPKIPGTMAGSVQNGHLSWVSTTTNTSPSRNPLQSSRRAGSRSSGPLVGVAEPTAAAADRSDEASIALSELETLKRKLEEAEERIRRLEAERVIQPTSSSGSAQHIVWSPPAGHDSSSHSFPQQISPNQMRFQLPPQRPFTHMPSNDAASSLAARSGSATTRTPPVSQSTGQRATQARSVGTRFVLYKPSSKTRQKSRQANSTPSN